MKKLRDLTIKEYKDLQELLMEEGEKDFYSIMEVVGEDMNGMGVEEFQRKWEELQKDTARNKKRGIHKFYKINNKIYTLSLNPFKLSAGQFLDLQHGMGRGEEVMLSTVLIPLWRRYGEGYDILKVREEIREHMRIGDAMEISDFFLNTSSRLLKTTLLFSRYKWMKMKQKEKQNK